MTTGSPKGDTVCSLSIGVSQPHDFSLYSMDLITAIVIYFGAKIVPGVSHKTAFTHVVIYIPYHVHQETLKACHPGHNEYSGSTRWPLKPSSIKTARTPWRSGGSGGQGLGTGPNVQGWHSQLNTSLCVGPKKYAHNVPSIPNPRITSKFTDVTFPPAHSPLGQDSASSPSAEGGNLGQPGVTIKSQHTLTCA